jgi:hypothetical protein
LCISAAKSPPNGEIVAKTCFGQLLQNYDSDMGGFSKAPKFPQPVNFNFLFTYYAANPKDDRGKQGTIHILRKHLYCSKLNLIKVEKVLKGSLDSIPSPSPSEKIQIMGGKVYLS